MENMVYPIDCRLRRHPEGVLIHVQVKPEIETFFQTHGGGLQTGPTSGRLWKSASKDDSKPQFWSFDNRLQSGNVAYDILSTGGYLQTEYGVNISFLRLVGASQQGGRNLIVEMVMSNQEISRVTSEISKAVTAFYEEYIQPVGMRAYVGVMDVTRMEQELQAMRVGEQLRAAATTPTEVQP